MAKNKANVAEFSLTCNEKKYNGKEWNELNGSFGIGGNNRILVSIQCESDGTPKVYTSKDGKNFIYARATKYLKGQNSGGTSRNELK